MAKGDAFKVEIEGGRVLRKALKQAQIDLKELSAINRRAAQIVAARAKQLAPVGDNKNGHIAATIRAGATQRAGIVRVGRANRAYAGVVHYGDRKRNIRKVRPFVIIAAQETEPQWLEQYYREITEIIERIG
ncbi:hypothetical protein [Rothia sp. ZJ1223]|uniref:hypothetical protein n=1 Tax=Rothia sp. ZJ1223 TaxID=2811098 RepID=UPI001958EB76|nr:hypothetical protein [Rothia sp. ZJ1223]MBM7052218.1 hypothetical protein [Rothia sp. ZJ1223]